MVEQPRYLLRLSIQRNGKCAELLLKKNSDLKKIIKSENIECENQTVNAEMRRAIWN